MIQAFIEPMRILRGTTFRETWDITEDGEAVDLTGCSVRAEARAAVDDAEPAFDLNPVITDPEGGRIRFEIAKADTWDITAATYYTHVILIRPDETEDPLLEGAAVPVIAEDSFSHPAAE